TLNATSEGREELIKREEQRTPISDPVSQNNQRLIRILIRGGVEVQQVTGIQGAGFTEHDSVMMVRLDQPAGAFAKALLERQAYPNLRDETGRPQQPYDVTAHTLPLLMNVKVIPVNAPFKYHYEVDYMGFVV